MQSHRAQIGGSGSVMLIDIDRRYPHLTRSRSLGDRFEKDRGFPQGCFTNCEGTMEMCSDENVNCVVIGRWTRGLGGLGIRMQIVYDIFG